MMDDDVSRVLKALAHPLRRAILERIVSLAEARYKDFADLSGSPGTLYTYLTTLEFAGLISKSEDIETYMWKGKYERTRKMPRYRPTKLGILVIDFLKTFIDNIRTQGS